MSMIRIGDAADPRIAEYLGVRDPELLRSRGLFVAENRLVVRTLLASTRFRTRSVLVTEAAYASLQDVLAPLERTVTVYVCPKSLMEPVSGYHIHRGCLALGERSAPVAVADLLATQFWMAGPPAPRQARSLAGPQRPAPLPRAARRLIFLEAMTNADNVGAIFRNARAFGVDAVVMGPHCCDPLYRKAIRVSIGATLVVPFATTDVPAPVGADPRVGPLQRDLLALKRAGFTLVALTPAADAIDLNDFAAGPLPDRIALLVGNEGEGLSAEALAACDARVRIAMSPGVDSLNASTATGIALHRMFTGR